MKNCFRLTLLCSCWTLLTYAQPAGMPLRFAQGNFFTGDNILRNRFQPADTAGAWFDHRYYLLLQFQQLPGKAEQEQLRAAGIHTETYVPGNGFLAVIDDNFDFKRCGSLGIRAVSPLPPLYRTDNSVRQYVPDGNKANTMMLAVQCSRWASAAAVRRALQQNGAVILTQKFENGQLWMLQYDAALTERLCKLPFVYAVSLVAQTDQALNYNTRAASGAGALNSATGKNLNGRGVVLGIGDNADISSHLDFNGRLINRSPWIPSNHGTHVAGTAAGAGIINPKNRGMAARATLVNQFFSDIIVNSPVYFNDYNMVLTNNSYHSAANGCAGEGAYNVLSVYADAQISSNSELQHVIAAGNDGDLTCSPYPAAFGTVKSGWQCAKNVLTVGALNVGTYSIASYSSRGPVADGRIKPEITANGFNVVSTNANNNYGANYGTSMACPAVSGGLTLMHERFRQRNGGANPKSALMKAIVCNTADDLGNPGPDYTYGFGMLNVRRAVDAIDSSRYFVSSMTGNGSNTHNFTVPANTRRLKVMLCWHDLPASASAASSLVNDLDLVVITPSFSLKRPLILNSSPAAVNSNATEGPDHVNNIEQVVIDNPVPGVYSANINGYSLPGGTQEYAVSYEIISNGVTVEHPAGGETLVPGETETIRWSSAGSESNSFTLEYSADNGSNWTLISNTVPAASRSYTWTVPAGATTGGRIRISRNSSPYTDQSDAAFTVLGQPELTVTNPCPGSAQLSWNAITGATGYDILQLSGDTLRTVGITAGTSFLLTGLNPNATAWLGVAARLNGMQGRRSVSVPVQPAGGACTLAAFSNDLRIDTILEPNSARRFFSDAGNVSRPVRIRIRNGGNSTVNGPFSVSLALGNGSPLFTETINSSLAAGASLTYSFSGTLPLQPQGGVYPLKVWVTHPSDPFRNNDTAYKTVKDIPNDPLSSLPFTENFESLPELTVSGNEMAVGGNSYLDFRSSTSRGRARSFVNSGMALSGNRALTLDQAPYSTSTNADSAILSYNLSAYTGRQLRVDFYYKNHGQADAPGNRVWIRGSDRDPWVQAYDLFAAQAELGGWSKAMINVNDVLGSAVPAQSVSSSFQLKIGQEGNTSANSVQPEVDIDDGYTLDNLVLNEAVNDVSLLSILTPDPGGCGLTASTPLSIRLRNYQPAALSNVQVNYSVNNGPVVTETISSLGAGQTLDYTFSQLMDLSAYTDYDINVWVKYSGDSYASNDSILHYRLHNNPVISRYPYYESFESDNGYYYTKGTNSSWEWGAPAKAIISKAPNGSKAWVTRLNGNYNDNETSYLYTPCFDLTGLARPMLSFSHLYDIEQDYDFTWVEYSTDGKTWQKLGTANAGTNWYDNAAGNNWSLSNTAWHVASFALPVNSFNPGTIRFRFVMSSDAGVSQEGIGIDDVRVFEQTDIAGSPAPLFPASDGAPWNNGWKALGYGDAVMGPWWIVGEINTHGQDLGTVTITPYLNYNNPVRSSNNTYYLDKSFVVSSTTPPGGPVSLRLYFSDQQFQDLKNANNCAGCVSPGDPYELGVLQYKGSAAEEDYNLDNNNDGYYTFISADSTLIIPHNSGYYAEFSTRQLGECWFAANDAAPAASSQCAGAVIRFTTGSGTGTYQWQLNTGNGYTNISDGVNYSGTTGASLDISGLPSSSSGYRYRCLVNGNPGPEYTLRFRNIWTGEVSTSWFAAGNWSCGTVPDEFTDVVIPGGKVRYPVLTANAAVRSLRVLAGVPLQINNGVQLQVKGRME